MLWSQLNLGQNSWTNSHVEIIGHHSRGYFSEVQKYTTSY